MPPCPVGNDYQLMLPTSEQGKKVTIMSSNEASMLNTFQQSHPSPLKSPKLVTLGSPSRRLSTNGSDKPALKIKTAEYETR